MKNSLTLIRTTEEDELDKSLRPKHSWHHRQRKGDKISGNELYRAVRTIGSYYSMVPLA
jgi:hypothetical protein